MCCCIMRSARSMASRGSGATLSAAWARSARRWRARRQATAWKSKPARPCAKSWLKVGVPWGALDDAFLRRMRNWRCGSGTFRMNVALSRLPDFMALPGREVADHHTAGIIFAPTLSYMDRAYCDARLQGWSREPIIEMLI